MSDQEWDADDFDADVSVKPSIPKATDKWAGEDEDDDIKDAWDVSDEEEGSENKQQNVAKKKKKSLKDIIAEKEARKQQEMEERRKQEEEAKRKLTPEEILAEKLRQQKIQEDSDLEMAKLTFGVNDTAAGASGGIGSFEPITKEDFDKYCTMLTEHISKLERSTHYVSFLEMLYRELAVALEVDDVKRLSSCLTAVYNEKNKQAKSLKGKKKGKGKANLNQGKDNNYDDYTTGAYDDLDDFM